MYYLTVKMLTTVTEILSGFISSKFTIAEALVNIRDSFLFSHYLLRDYNNLFYIVLILAE